MTISDLSIFFFFIFPSSLQIHPDSESQPGWLFTLLFNHPLFDT